jgi:hypothetical protein
MISKPVADFFGSRVQDVYNGRVVTAEQSIAIAARQPALPARPASPPCKLALL